jgi:hypothetical protein
MMMVPNLGPVTAGVNVTLQFLPGGKVPLQVSVPAESSLMRGCSVCARWNCQYCICTME